MFPFSPSKRREIPLDFPRLDLGVILTPLVALDRKLVRDRAQAFPYNLISLEMSESFGEALGQSGTPRRTIVSISAE